jgi:hypothetical protein
MAFAAPEQLRETFAGVPPGAVELPPPPQMALRPDLAPLNATPASTASAAAETAVLLLARQLHLNASRVPVLDAGVVLAMFRQLSDALAALRPATGWPPGPGLGASSHAVLRRVVMAALVRFKLRLHVPGLSKADGELLARLRFDPTSDPLFFRIMRQLFNLHRQVSSPGDPGIWVWLVGLVGAGGRAPEIFTRGSRTKGARTPSHQARLLNCDGCPLSTVRHAAVQSSAAGRGRQERRGVPARV